MKSVEKLEHFINKEYLLNPSMESPDASTAIRDICTDLFHLGDKWGICIEERLTDAQEVYEQEVSVEIEAKTGVIDS